MHVWWFDFGQFVISYFPEILGTQILIIVFCLAALRLQWANWFIYFGFHRPLSNSKDAALMDLEEFFEVSGDEFRPRSYFGKNLQLALEEAKRGEI